MATQKSPRIAKGIAAGAPRSQARKSHNQPKAICKAALPPAQSSNQSASQGRTSGGAPSRDASRRSLSRPTLRKQPKRRDNQAAHVNVAPVAPNRRAQAAHVNVAPVAPNVKELAAPPISAALASVTPASPVAMAPVASAEPSEGGQIDRELHAVGLVDNPPFPIVGIGASAGGLEALEQFMRRMPQHCGMAFVVVQHQDPRYKGLLVELLQRCSTLPVVQAVENCRIACDHVYVIPPNKDMSLEQGRLHLLEPASPRGLNLPIDFFLRSLAEAQQEHSIAVILSGMGTDGTLGLRAIKEKAGVTFVQSLGSAKFDSMPRSAIDAGLADVVAAVEELPDRILAYRDHAPHVRRLAPSVESSSSSAIDKVCVLLRTHTGNDFSHYKRSALFRRIQRRMGLHQIDSVTRYVQHMRENPREIELLFKELLIGVTSFFRDPGAWRHLKQDVVPRLLGTFPQGGVLRAWVPGCSTGEEAYSLAIVLKEALEPLEPLRNVAIQIFATDLDRDAIARARQGLFPDNIAQDVSPERLRRYFVQEERGYRVTQAIREAVVFAPQNLIMDPPFTKLDLIACRNLLIYVSGDLQKRLIPLFHYCLNPGGILFLGSAETVGAFSDLFTPLDGKTRLYRRISRSPLSVPVEFASPLALPRGNSNTNESNLSGQVKPTPPSLQVLADRLLVQRFSPVGVLCNDKGDILYISSRAGKYLEPAVGKANLNVFAMAREGLRCELSRAFSTAVREERLVAVHSVNVKTNSHTQAVDLTIQKLLDPKELRGTVLIVLADVSTPPGNPRPVATHPISARAPVRIVELELKLARARQEAQTIREEMQTSQEELRSTNEELQSTNEELTTSKEEMQSLNEELHTVNHELQSKVDELCRSNNDMKNLLNSTEIATLFLDGNLNVRRFTTPTTKIIKLIPGDAGRPLTDIVSDLDYPDLAEDAREVLRTLVFKEKTVDTRDGRSFSVRVMPYRTLENVIDGVVITFTDSCAFRRLEFALREQADQLKQMAESLPNLVWGCRTDGASDYVSPQWVQHADVSENAPLGLDWLERVHPEDRDRTREEWRVAVKSGSQFDSEHRIRCTNGKFRWFDQRSVPIRDSSGTILCWYGTSTDVDDLKRSEEAQRLSLATLEGVLENILEGYFAMDVELTIIGFNRAAERLLQRSRQDVLGRQLYAALPELHGSDFEMRLAQACLSRTTSSFDTAIEGTPYRGTYRVRVFAPPHPKGFSVFFERIEATATA